MYAIECGAGDQKISWLGDVAINRLDPDYGYGTGGVHEICMENGVKLDIKRHICDDLQDDVHVHIKLAGKNFRFELF